jgi:hypothetical protein
MINHIYRRHASRESYTPTSFWKHYNEPKENDFIGNVESDAI